MFMLGWHEYGGSGLGWPPHVVEEMEVRERDWYVERVHEQRDAEAAKIKAAMKGPGGG